MLDPKPATQLSEAVNKPPLMMKKTNANALFVPSSNESLNRVSARLCRQKTTRLALAFLERCADTHLKDLVIEDVDDHRRARILDRDLFNFGSDSFLGLDRDERLHKAIIEALPRWGTHNGASRAFSSIVLAEEAERRLAKWLGVEDTLIFPSVTLANAGLIPAVAGKGDLLIVDRQSHDSIQQGARLAAAGGAKVVELHPCRADVLEGILQQEKQSGCVTVVDGVYSMTGKVAPLVELDEVTRRYGGIVYCDDAHGTGVVGKRGRGAASSVLPHLNDILLVGSLSKGLSCLGAFVTCNDELKEIMKIRSSTYIFGGPVPPPYLAAIIAAVEILDSDEGDELIAHLRSLVDRLTNGLRALGLIVHGGVAPIVSVQVGDIEHTLAAGKWLFEHGFYVQSATYPAVGITEGLIRIQVNANHPVEAVDGLIAAFAELQQLQSFPRATAKNAGS